MVLRKKATFLAFTGVCALAAGVSAQTFEPPVWNGLRPMKVRASRIVDGIARLTMIEDRHPMIRKFTHTTRSTPSARLLRSDVKRSSV